MNTTDIMRTINRLAQKRDRQKAALGITETELAHWEAQLEDLKKGKK